MIGPLTLAQQLRAWRRRGCQCRLDGSGRLRSRGMKKLAAAERDALADSAPMVLELLLARRSKRRTRESRQRPERDAMEPQPGRRVVGMQVVPGYPALSKLVYADELRVIRPSPRARQLPSVGWSKFMGGE